jgi:hypothetical protein
MAVMAVFLPQMAAAAFVAEQPRRHKRQLVVVARMDKLPGELELPPRVSGCRLSRYE